MGNIWQFDSAKILLIITPFSHYKCHLPLAQMATASIVETWGPGFDSDPRSFQTLPCLSRPIIS